MRLSKWQLALVAIGMAGLYVVLDSLKSLDPGRITAHFVGSALVIATLPFMKWRLVRFFQLCTLGWLFGDIAFRNWFGPAAPIRTDAGTWRGVLALAYAALLMMIVLYDRAIRRVELQCVSRDPGVRSAE